MEHIEPPTACLGQNRPDRYLLLVYDTSGKRLLRLQTFHSWRELHALYPQLFSTHNSLYSLLSGRMKVSQSRSQAKYKNIRLHRLKNTVVGTGDNNGNGEEALICSQIGSALGIVR